jgi:hypothetical protein
MDIEKLKKKRTAYLLTLCLGIGLSVFSYFKYNEVNNEIMVLDKMRLDGAVLK